MDEVNPQEDASSLGVRFKGNGDGWRGKDRSSMYSGTKDMFSQL